MRINVSITTDAVSEPITLTEAKLFLKADTTTEDDLITDLITSARKWIEDYTGKSMAVKTLTVMFWDFLDDETEFDLPYPPHASITSVSEVDEEGTATALTLNSGYYKKGLTDFTIQPVQSYEPAYKVVYITGSAFDDTVKKAMLNLIADFYENRQNEKEESNSPIQMNTKAILAGHRKIPFRL